MNPKVNVKAQLEFDLPYSDVTVLNHDSTVTRPAGIAGNLRFVYEHKQKFGNSEKWVKMQDISKCFDKIN